MIPLTRRPPGRSDSQTESRTVGAMRWGRGGERTFNGDRASDWEDESFLAKDGGKCCTDRERT